MAIGSLSLTQDHQNVEYHLVTLFEKLDAVRRDATCVSPSASTPTHPSMQVEVRTLEFWRSIISECLAAFFYVFIVCGAASGAGGTPSSLLSTTTTPTSSVTLATALATGFAVATLTQCFGHISGAHVNPAVTVAMVVTRNITPLRAIMFVTAQCGGGIAGAALLYGVAVPGYMGNLSATVSHLPAHLNSWERFAVEFILTFIVVFTYFVSMDTYRKILAHLREAGCACAEAFYNSMPSMNPSRTLGPAFVMNKWDSHWVYWFGPMLGGMVSGLIYEFIFNPRRHVRQPKESIDGDSSSIHSDEDPYDELDKPAAPKFEGSTYNTLRGADIYRPAGNHGGPPTPASPTGPSNAYCPSLTSASLYSAPPCKLDRVESLYGGTKSLYAKSPPLTRANLNRSQSVYSKVPSGPVCTRDGLPRPGPLVPAQSLYPMRFSQNHNTANQNVQNQQSQLQQRSESIYGIRG
ncbi:Neurogenic protein big brain, partial [Zootermopsis nevadensis]